LAKALLVAVLVVSAEGKGKLGDRVAPTATVYSCVLGLLQRRAVQSQTVSPMTTDRAEY